MPSDTVKRVISTVSLLVGLGVLFYLFSTLPFGDVWTQFLGVNAVLIAKYLLAIIFIRVVLSWRWRAVLQSRDMNTIPFAQLFNVHMAGTAVSFLTPTAKLGGEPVRALLFHKETEHSFKKSLSAVVIDKTIELSTSGLFFIVGLIVALLSYSVSTSLRNTLVGVIIFLLVLIGGFFIRVFNGKNFFAWLFSTMSLDKVSWLQTPIEKLHDFEELVVDFYHTDRAALFKAIMLSMLSWVGMFFEYYYVGLIVGVELSILEVFIIFTFVGLAYLIPVPMAVGTLEAGQVSAFSLIGLRSAAGLGVSIVVRTKDMLVSAYGLVCLLLRGMSIRSALEEADIFAKDVEEADEALEELTEDS